MMKESPEDLYEKFMKAATCKSTLQAFQSLCENLDLIYPPPRGNLYDHISFYPRLKQALGQFWKAQSLFSKLDKRFNDEVNFTGRKGSRDGQERVAKDFNVLIIGAGPCGLRTAIFTALLGAKTVVVEKRDSFSRNNVLHLWPFTIEDLKALGAKKFNGRFCSGAIDHVSIRQLQLILMKAALIFGVEIHVNTAFVDVIPPNVPDSQVWTAEIEPKSSTVSKFGFHVIVGADGRKNTLKGFERKTFRGSLAIGITVNFINKRTSAEARVEEISGINFIYRQEFFRALNMKHDIDLENIVYYKDDTHYFVMTARKQSLLRREVLKENLDDPKYLVHPNNIDQKALLEYALDAVNFSTENKLPDLEVAINKYGLPDIALFDFTCMKSSVNASMFRESNGVKLLQSLVGDGLLEPFWPKGTGIAKGFLAAYDTSWMLRQWAVGKPQDKANDTSFELSLLAERESLYRILAQIESNNLVQNYPAFTLDPKTRYQFTPKKLTLGQVRCFYYADGKACMTIPKQDETDGARKPSSAGLSKLTRNVSFVRSNKLLNWCEKVLSDCRSDVLVTNMTSSWKDGRALCTIISYYRPDILDPAQIKDDDAEFNNQLAFDIAYEHLGLTPIMSGKEMAECAIVDDLIMVTYLSQFYELFKNETPVKPVGRVSDIIPTLKDDAPHARNKRKTSPLSIITKVKMQFKRRKPQLGSVHEYKLDSDRKRRKTANGDGAVAANEDGDVVLTKADLQTDADEEIKPAVVMRDSPKTGGRTNATDRISALQQQLISRFEQNSDAPRQVSARSKSTNSSICCFCGKTVYIVERLSVEGLFFHRQCFKCSHCDTILNTLNYKKDIDSGKFYCVVHYFANAEYLKTQYDDRDAFEDEGDRHDEMDGVFSSDSTKSPTVSPMLGDDLNMSIPTIEKGQVVMKKDLTPRRSDMAEMSWSIQANRFGELEEDEIYEHNIRRSNTSYSDDEFDSCDSELEELDEFVASQPNWNSQKADDIHMIIKKYKDQKSVDESAFDDDVSSISSSSCDDTALMDEFLNEKSGLTTDAEIFESANEVELRKTQDSKNLELVDDISLSSASSVESDSLEGEEKIISDKISVKSDNSVKRKDVGLSVVKLERKDTLEGAEKHIKEHPIRTRELSSSSSSNEDEKVSEVQQTSFSSRGNKKLATNVSSSSSSSDVTSKDSLESAEGHLKQHPVSKSRSFSSSSSDTEKESSMSSEDVVDSETIGLARRDMLTTPSVKSRDDTSVWVDSTAERMEVTSNPTTNFGKHSIAAPQADSYAALSTPTVTISTPSAMSPEIFATPNAQSEFDDTFYSTKSNESAQDISPYASNIEDRGDKKVLRVPNSFKQSSVESSMKILETPKPRQRRKLPVPVIPHLEVISPQKSDSMPVLSQRTASRRKLPVIPHLEKQAFDEMSPRQRKRIGEKLEAHEKRVMERLEKTTSPPPGLVSPASEDLSPSQRKRIAKKLQKHEDRVMERIEKMKFGYKDTLFLDDVSDKAQEDRDEFTKYVPLMLQRRSNALLKRKPNNHQRYFTGSKDKDVKASGYTKNRSSSKKKLSSYTDEELHHRVLHQAKIAAERQAKEEERKRMARGMVLQGQLQEVESKRKQLEKRGVELEKLLRDQKEQGVRTRDSSLHMHEWFKLVQEKNALLRYENELWIHQKELQLEDRKSRLERELRDRWTIDPSKKTKDDLKREKEIELDMQRCVDQRNELVMLIDEYRVQDRNDGDIEKVLKDSMSSLDLTTPL